MDNTELIERIFREYQVCEEYKSTLGERGLFEQSKMNERFFAGDQWHGAMVSAKRPLVRHNIIRRIGDYKRAVIENGEYPVSFSAKGISDTDVVFDDLGQAALSRDNLDECTKTNVALKILGSHFDCARLTAGLDDVLNEALKNAYISGTGVIYTYWDAQADTGEFADNDRSQRILGDVRVKCIDIENIGFGEPCEPDVDRQPYIIIKSRMSVNKARALALENGISKYESETVKSDYDGNIYDTATQGGKVTVLTKLERVRDELGKYHITAVQVCRGCVIRQLWDMKISRYPISIYHWNVRKNCIYGESEITYLIPNQIAINRMMTASVWATMLSGMPMMLVNGDTVKSEITNSPGQVITFSGESEDFANAIKYVSPPQFSENITKSADSLIDDTLEMSGASKAALGIYEMNNASAIESLQKASAAPLKEMIKRYSSFICSVAGIFAEFFINFYGQRRVLVQSGARKLYLPFDGAEYKGLVLNVTAGNLTVDKAKEQEEDVDERQGTV